MEEREGEGGGLRERKGKSPETHPTHVLNIRAGSELPIMEADKMGAFSHGLRQS